MKKPGLIALLGQLKSRNEGKPAKEYETTPMEIALLLLEYINDPQIKAAVDEIPF